MFSSFAKIPARVLLYVAALAFAGVLAGCGGDNDGSHPPPPPPPPPPPCNCGAG